MNITNIDTSPARTPPTDPEEEDALNGEAFYLLPGLLLAENYIHQLRSEYPRDEGRCLLCRRSSQGKRDPSPR